MSTVGENKNRLFTTLDTISDKKSSGMAFRPLSTVESTTEMIKNTALPSFVVDLGSGSIAVDRKQFHDFLERNSQFQHVLTLEPEVALQTIWKENLLKHSAWALLHRESTSMTTNIFSFIENHSDHIKDASTASSPDRINEKSGYEALSILKEKFDAIDPKKPVDQEMITFKRRLTKLWPDTSLSLGLQNPDILDRIVQDARSYIKEHAHTTCDASVTVEMRQHHSEISQLVSQVENTRGVGGYCLSPVPSDPSSVFFCKKTAAHEYTLSSIRITNPLAPHAKETLRDKLSKLYPEHDVNTIMLGHEIGWKGFIEQDPQEPTLFRQVHGIAGLKIYPDFETGVLIPDIAVERLAEGSHKKAKYEYRLLPDGTLVDAVRYGWADKRSVRAEELLAKEINTERAIRKELGPIPQILPLTITGSYIGKEQKIKRRAASPKCEGTLTLLKDKIKGDPHAFAASLTIFGDVISALAAMHEKGVVHNDVKPDNVLYLGGKGFFGDLALATKIGPAFKRPGSPLYQLLTNLDSFDPKSDIMSLGIAMLETYYPDVFEQFISLQLARHTDIKNGLLGVSDERAKIHAEVEAAQAEEEAARAGEGAEAARARAKEARERAAMVGTEAAVAEAKAAQARAEAMEKQGATTREVEKAKDEADAAWAKVKYLSGVDTLREGLLTATDVAGGTDLGPLIAACMDPAPSRRPTASEAKEQLDAIMAARRQANTLPPTYTHPS